ncbi:hypothetical protein DL93DRAFT_378391 [Clavulina sp. PMI_390]|nr:hypothetical protein DL93DRAFT_378391 [Clavulina sp. PMI_390]
MIYDHHSWDAWSTYLAGANFYAATAGITPHPQPMAMDYMPGTNLNLANALHMNNVMQQMQTQAMNFTTSNASSGGGSFAFSSPLSSPVDERGSISPPYASAPGPIIHSGLSSVASSVSSSRPGTSSGRSTQSPPMHRMGIAPVMF